MRIEEYICYGAAAIVIVVIIFVLYRRMRPSMKHGEILQADVMKTRYNLTSDHYKPPQFDPEKVPEHLRDLLPLAEKWGIEDDIIRADYQEKALENEKRAIQKSLSGRGSAITEWLDSFGSDPMPREAAAFMYMMLGLDEMGIYIIQPNNG